MAVLRLPAYRVAACCFLLCLARLTGKTDMCFKKVNGEE